MYDKVFISYAKEDHETAEKLFDFLKVNLYDPWLDKKKLLPGQDWNTEIRLALKKADFIVLLLSKTSVAKRGFVQREFKFALEYCEEKLDTDIYIIPCKIDDCEVPDKLGKFQWIELSNSESFELILNSLDLQRKKYKDFDRKKIALHTSFEFDETVIQKSIGTNPKTNIEIVYPQFIDSTNVELRLINSCIEQLFFKNYNNFNLLFEDGLFGDAGKNINEKFRFPNNELQLSYKIELLNNNFISFTVFNFTYTGGAHGMYGTTGHNYKLNPLIEFNLETLLDHQDDTLLTLQTLCREKLLKKAKEELKIEKEEDFFLFDNPLELKWDTFSNFYLNNDSIVIIFNIYEITPYALGQHEVEVKFDELLSRHTDLQSLQKVKRLLI